MKYFLTMLLVVFLVFFGCKSVSSLTTNTPSGTCASQICEGLVYPSDAMDPCEVLSANWVAVNNYAAGDSVFVALKNTDTKATRTHCVLRLVGESAALAASCYLDKGQICFIQYDGEVKQFVWVDLSPARYDVLKRMFEFMFEGKVKVEPQKKGC